MDTMWLQKHCAWAMVLVACSGTLAEAQNTTTRVSVATGGAQATGGSQGSRFSDVSGNGRFIAFQSSATNLVAGDTNGVDDIFVHDRETGTTERVNLGPGGVQANAMSAQPNMSDDGRYVVFASNATNLVTGDTNAAADIFVRDRQTGTTTRVSVATGGGQATGASSLAKISGDGRMIAIWSIATNLVAGDTNGLPDIFRHDQQTGTTIRVSVTNGGAQAGGAGSFNPAISTDGNIVVFYSESPSFVTGDTNGVGDVFVRDVQAGTTTRVSVKSDGSQGTALSANPDVSSDGRYVVFQSTAGNLDPAGGVGIFLHDRQAATTSPVAVVPPATYLDELLEWAKISGNGRYVVFERVANSMVPTVPPRVDHVFIVDRQTSTTTRLDVRSDGVEGDSAANNVAINEDGTVVTFGSGATNLVASDTNSQGDIFVRYLAGNAGGGPTVTMTLDKTSLAFAAVTNGAAFLSQTAPQVVRLTQSGAGTVTWTATSTQPWLQVSPTSGSGSANLSITIISTGGLAAGGTVNGTITLVLTGASGTAGPINVALRLFGNGTTAIPEGVVDTPMENSTGVTGAVPFTGWALDDIEVSRVMICRAAFGAEVAPVDPNCAGVAQIFVGFAVFIDGARPDVQAAYPTMPVNTKAGWGFMVLTNMLPAQGNGTYLFYMYAQDREGHTKLLGTRTMTCANVSATKPFGAIDTPTQGGVASGGSFVNFGWALTPLPKMIPTDGSTISVLIDGISIGTATYNNPRPDIQSLFPGLNNTNGAIGFRVIDTTAIANGLHTISWTVVDNQGAIEGIGSRFFTVSNGAGALTAAPVTITRANEIATAPRADAPVLARRGWDLEGPWRWYGLGSSGRAVIRGEEIDRFEVWLGAQPEAHYTGHLRVGDGLAPLPVGSQLDAGTGWFTWAPGVGFVGTYDLVFVRWAGGRPVARHEVRVILAPKGRGHVGMQVAIDTPRSQQDVGQPFVLAGWAADLDAATTTGIDTLHAWAYPLAGGAPVFLGTPTLGGARPDVAAIHGDQFRATGFTLAVQGLPPGIYDLAVFPWSNVTGAFAPPKIVHVTVRP